jgi:hypothetical protein
VGGEQYRSTLVDRVGMERGDLYLLLISPASEVGGWLLLILDGTHAYVKCVDWVG